MVKWVILFAPFGILGLVFTSVSENGLEVFTTYGHLVLLLVECMLANTLIFNPLISYIMLRRNPYPLLFTCLKERTCSFFNISNDVAMQAVAVGFIIGVIQDSIETALNSSGDVFFTATAEYYDRMKKERHQER